MTELTERQRKFCNEYLKDFNATRAYKAVYNPKTDESAYTNASRLLRKDKVAEYIEKRKKKQEDKAIITQEEILRELRKIAMNEKESSNNRMKAMELCGKHLGMFKETNLNVNMNFEEYLNKVADDDDY